MAGGSAIIQVFTKKPDRVVRDGLPDLYPRLWRWCMSLTGAPDRADDLAQATTLRAIEKAALFEPGTRLDAWVFTLAKRIWLNELRANSVRQAGGLVPVEDTPIADPRSETSIETNIFANEVLARLTHLPEAQRTTVMLVYVEGMKYKEAAKILEVPVGTIMSRLSSARARLAEWAESETRRAKVNLSDEYNGRTTDRLH